MDSLPRDLEHPLRFPIPDSIFHILPSRRSPPSEIVWNGRGRGVLKSQPPTSLCDYFLHARSLGHSDRWVFKICGPLTDLLDVPIRPSLDVYSCVDDGYGCNVRASRSWPASLSHHDHAGSRLLRRLPRNYSSRTLYRKDLVGSPLVPCVLRRCWNDIHEQHSNPRCTPLDRSRIGTLLRATTARFVRLSSSPLDHRIMGPHRNTLPRNTPFIPWNAIPQSRACSSSIDGRTSPRQHLSRNGKSQFARRNCTALGQKLSGRSPETGRMATSLDGTSRAIWIHWLAYGCRR